MITTYRQAFDLYLRQHAAVESYLQNRTQDPEATAEISQRVVEKIARSCCNGRKVANEAAWVRTIARNAATDYFKDLNRRESCCISPTATLPSDNPYAQIEVFLRPLVCFLPEKYADPLRLYLFDRLPQREIAARLGLGLSATKSRIARARQLLRREIETCFALEVSTDGRGLVSACLRDSCTPLKEFAKSLP